jgi:hypothetical protein
MMELAAVTVVVLTAALCAMWVVLLGERAPAAAYRARVHTAWH